MQTAVHSKRISGPNLRLALVVVGIAIALIGAVAFITLEGDDDRLPATISTSSYGASVSADLEDQDGLIGVDQRSADQAGRSGSQLSPFVGLDIVPDYEHQRFQEMNVLPGDDAPEPAGAPDRMGY